MSKCAVQNCKKSRYRAGKTNVDIIIHSFPQQQALYQKWVKFCRQDENWQPSAYFGICSNHFRNEDYQFSSLEENKKRSRMLFPNAIPSIFQSPPYPECVKREPNTKESHATIVKREANSADADNSVQTDSFLELLKYRDHFCRICLNCYESESLISIYSQVQNNTILDMLIQLTAFETENYDELPTVICVECKHKLEQACDIRQQFIAQSELLVRLVAEEKIMDYFREGTVQLEGTVEFLPNESYDTASNGESCHEDAGVDHEDDEEHQLENVDSNDHTQGTEADGSVQLEDGAEEMLAEAEKAYEKSITSELQPHAMRTLDKKRKKRISWKHLSLSGEEARKRKAEILRERARAYSLACNRKRYRLEAEAQNSFPLTTCYVCDKKHDTLMERDFHLRDHIPMLPYHCKECNEGNAATDNSGKDCRLVLKTTNQLNAHFRMHSMPYKCDKCYRRFCTDLKLKTHYWSSHGIAEKGLTCEYCGKQYFQRTMFNRHVAYHRNELSGQFKCSICDRALGSNSSLRRHEASHKGEKKYKCLYCEKLFSTSYNRLTHQRVVHTGERPHKCDECGRSFVDNSRLKLHQESHHVEGRSSKERIRKSAPLPEDKQSCSYPGCNYMAETYRTMYMHKRTKHMTMHKCEVCKKEFPFVANLREHMRVHTGEKPYRCEVCDRSFRHSAMYRRHLLTHSDTGSSYSCALCKKSFKMARYLQAHMLTHSSERNFICGICGNTYKTKGELKKHTQNKHANEFNGDYVILSGDSTVEQNQWIKTYVMD